MAKNTTKRSITLHNETLKDIEKLALKNKINTSEQIRRFIDEGLKIKSYREDIDFIADILRKELLDIFRMEDIELLLEKNNNRLTKMMYKIGALNCGQLFLLINMFLEIIDTNDEVTFDKILEKSMENGIDYLEKPDFKVNSFLKDSDELKNIARKL
ncbi:MAG: hypothetical protein ACLUCH_06560 [Lachnospirales bacterium]